MKDKEEIKDKLIEYGIDIGKNILIYVVKEKIIPKKKEKIISTNVKEIKKPKKKIVKKLLFAYLFKKVVVDRVMSKINVQQNNKDYAWIIDYPVSQNFVDLKSLVNSLNKDSQILDLGSGTGYFGIEAAKHLTNGKSYCLDNNMDSLKNAQRMADLFRIENIEFHRANIEAIPFEDKKFDAIFLNMTFGQLNDKINSLSEISRVLKPAGKIYITELLIDNNYMLSSTIINLANNCGLKAIEQKGNLISYTLVFQHNLSK